MARPGRRSRLIRYRHLIGGVVGGYNWQTGNLVYGLEGGITTPDGSSTVGFVRARLGFAAGRWHVYGTGGVAFTDGLEAGTEKTPVSGFTWHYDGYSSVGYVAGGGVETKITDHLIVGVEALYYGFGNGSQNLTVNYSGGPISGSAAVPATVKTSGDATTVVARLTYQFDW